MTDDLTILELFFARSEEALSKAENAYGTYIRYIAARILRNGEDAEECLNDTLLHAWQSIPPAKPRDLRRYLGGIARHAALEKLEKKTAGKRVRGDVLPLDEYEECMPDTGKSESALLDAFLFRDALNRFLAELPAETRILFVRRYYYNCSLEELSKSTGKRVGTIKSLLYRTRNKLKEHLTKEGIFNE